MPSIYIFQRNIICEKEKGRRRAGNLWSYKSVNKINKCEIVIYIKGPRWFGWLIKKLYQTMCNKFLCRRYLRMKRTKTKESICLSIYFWKYRNKSVIKISQSLKWKKRTTAQDLDQDQDDFTTWLTVIN